MNFMERNLRTTIVRNRSAYEQAPKRFIHEHLHRKSYGWNCLAKQWNAIYWTSTSSSSSSSSSSSRSSSRRSSRRSSSSIFCPPPPFVPPSQVHYGGSSMISLNSCWNLTRPKNTKTISFFSAEHNHSQIWEAAPLCPYYCSSILGPTWYPETPVGTWPTPRLP